MCKCMYVLLCKCVCVCEYAWCPSTLSTCFSSMVDSLNFSPFCTYFSIKSPIGHSINFPLNHLPLESHFYSPSLIFSSPTGQTFATGFNKEVTSGQIGISFNQTTVFYFSLKACLDDAFLLIQGSSSHSGCEQKLQINFQRFAREMLCVIKPGRSNLYKVTGFRVLIHYQYHCSEKKNKIRPSSKMYCPNYKVNCYLYNISISISLVFSCQ